MMDIVASCSLTNIIVHKKSHTSKSLLATNKTAAWRHAWLWRSGSCVIDSVELRRGRGPEGMGRMVIRTRERHAREGVVTLE